MAQELDDADTKCDQKSSSSSPSSSLPKSQDLEDLLLEELEDDDDNDRNDQIEDGDAFRPSKKSRLGVKCTSVMCTMPLTLQLSSARCIH